MLRRSLFGWSLGTAALACLDAWGATVVEGSSIAAVPARRPRLRGICFDLFTLFDPRSVVRVAEAIVPHGAAELCEAWRIRQFEYAWLRAAGGRYRDFRAVTLEALQFAALAHGLALSTATQNDLVQAYVELEPWPDTRAALLRWKRQGLKLAPLTNYSPAMLEGLISHAGLAEMFDTLISTDVVQTFKPDPRTYALGPRLLGLGRDQIAFAAFGGWDAAGAKWFGYPTFWVNRLGVTPETLDPAPDGTGPTLAELSRFIEMDSRARSR